MAGLSQFTATDEMPDGTGDGGDDRVDDDADQIEDD